MRRQIRPRAHEIDSQARRQVPGSLPAEWEHRELTGRDYGIDMTVEIFESGEATGRYLQLQIKGTGSSVTVRSGSPRSAVSVGKRSTWPEKPRSREGPP